MTSDSVRLFFKVAGRGAPCLYLHGGPGAGSYSFERLGGCGLEKHQQLIYLDQRGSGRSASSTSHDYRLDRIVEDLEELRQHLGIARWTLLAHSFGAVVAVAYATRYPERVQALVLANGVLNPLASLASMMHYGDSLLPAAARPVLPATADIPTRLNLVMEALAQQHQDYRLQYATEQADRRASRLLHRCPGNTDFSSAVFNFQEYSQDFAPQTARLIMPVLVLAGRDDYTAGPQHYRSFRFPNQRIVLLPGVHNLLTEHPRIADRAIIEFLANLPQKLAIASDSNTGMGAP